MCRFIRCSVCRHLGALDISDHDHGSGSVPQPDIDVRSPPGQFTPPYSVRVKEWPNPISLVIGKRRRDAAYGFPEQAFEQPYTRRKFFNRNIHMVSDPDIIAHVLLHNQQNFVKPDFLQRVLRPMIGQGLFTAERQHWRTQRRIVAPTFKPSAIASLIVPIAEIAKRQTAAWPSTRTRIDMAEQADRKSVV